MPEFFLDDKKVVHLLVLGLVKCNKNHCLVRDGGHAIDTPDPNDPAIQDFEKCPACFRKKIKKQKKNRDQVFPEINGKLHRVKKHGETICGLSYDTQTVFADEHGFILDPDLRLAKESCSVCFSQK